jgi:hypothetical protein
MIKALHSSLHGSQEEAIQRHLEMGVQPVRSWSMVAVALQHRADQLLRVDVIIDDQSLVVHSNPSRMKSSTKELCRQV